MIRVIERAFHFVPKPVWLACAALLPYLPFLSLPIISDTYLQIFLARQFGAPDGWADLAADPLYRCRATSLVFTWLIDLAFGASGPAHKLANVAVHVLNVLLVYLLGRWRLIGYRVSFPAALFFAFYEGHQEAIVWVAALPELLMFLFSLVSLHAWIQWSGNGFGKAGWRWALAASAGFALALLSKESAVALVPVLAWIAWRQHGASAGAAWWTLGSFAAICCVYSALIFAASREHLHLNDGTFSLRAPVWLVLPNSAARLFWIWGMVALAALAAWRAYRHWARTLEFSALWIVCTLLPYSFLVYMDRVPSRHTYFAAAGLAVIIGMAFATVRSHWRARWVAPALLAVMVAHNCGYLWFRKLGQYEERAAATEHFLEFAREREGELVVRCGGPYGIDVYRYAAAVALGRSPDSVRRWDEGGAVAAADTFCESVHP